MAETEPTSDDPSLADGLLSEAGAGTGDKVRVTRAGRTYEGVVMPRHGFSGADVLVLKLGSGYNVGFALEDGDAVELVEAIGPRDRPTPELPAGVEDLPQVALLGTGGTIASFVEYRTGAVFPATTPEELAAAVPEAFEVANLTPEVVFETFSEDLAPEHWEQLGEAIERHFAAGARGVVVAHGTDTLHFTAAALQCLFDELPGPVVLVGAQRSSDRPSSDAATNLVHAVRVAAQAEAGEVFVVMHAGMSDEAWSIHAAGRARKMHTSRRDAFQSINMAPVGTSTADGIAWHVDELRPPGDGCRRTGGFEQDVGLVWSYPAMTADELKAAAGKGLVIAGTGLGHIPRRLIPTVGEIVDGGCLVVVASQCLHGRTNLRVYETGRELTAAGAVEAGDMLPETAYVKLAWALSAAEGDAKRARELFAKPRGREQAERTGFHYATASPPATAFPEDDRHD